MNSFFLLGKLCTLYLDLENLIGIRKQNFISRHPLYRGGVVFIGGKDIIVQC